MKVLLLSTSRSGSSAFANALSKALNISLITIPDNFNYNKDNALIDYILSKNSVIVRMDPIHEIGYNIENFCQHFDHTLLLTRLNYYDHLLSSANVAYRVNYSNLDVHSNYSVLELPENFLLKFENSRGWMLILKSKCEIFNLSYKLNNDILFYENIFQSDFNISEHLSFITPSQKQAFDLHLHSSKKLRIEKRIELI